MKMLKLIVLLLAVCSGLLSYSQSGGDSTISNNSMVMDHSGVQKFIESHKMIVKRKPFSEGFRIQIYNGNNREDANRIKSEFYGKFPGMRCYLTYMQPYYKVRIGDYVDQESARGDLKKLARFYPSSFLVPDQIRRTGDNEDKDTKASK
jgi:hypothetical protein